MILLGRRGRKKHHKQIIKFSLKNQKKTYNFLKTIHIYEKYIFKWKFYDFPLFVGIIKNHKTKTKKSKKP